MHGMPLAATKADQNLDFLKGADSTMRPAARPRLESVDVVRGVIMIIMALDHTRDFFGIPGQNPVDLTKPPPRSSSRAGLRTFCAPVFFLLDRHGRVPLARASARRPISRDFCSRAALWLIFLEVVVVRCLAYQFNFDYPRHDAARAVGARLGDDHAVAARALSA